MPVAYSALKGNAGTIKFWLSQTSVERIPVTPVPINTVYINVTDFDEEMEESELNATFDDINSNLRKIHYGRRQVISFTVVNSANMPAATGSTKSNLQAIQEIINMISIIDTNPWDYNLKIQYRGSAVYGTINDAVYTGGIKLTELKADSNIAQSMSFEFKSRILQEPNFGADILQIPMFVTEISTPENPIILINEDDTIEDKIILHQTIPFSTTP